MSKCLYCYKELGPGEVDFHKSCCRKFFGFAYQPGNPNEPDEPDIKPVQKKYKLTVVSEEGGTNVSGSGEYVSGTQVTLSVSISTGFSFQG